MVKFKAGYYNRAGIDFTTCGNRKYCIGCTISQRRKCEEEVNARVSKRLAERKP